MNVSEVYAGMRPKEEAKTEALLQSLEYYEISWDVVKQAGLLKRDYGKKGRTLSLPDTTIAAVALEYNLTLITDNIKHYPTPQLKLYPPCLKSDKKAFSRIYSSYKPYIINAQSGRNLMSDPNAL